MKIYLLIILYRWHYNLLIIGKEIRKKLVMISLFFVTRLNTSALFLVNIIVAYLLCIYNVFNIKVHYIKLINRSATFGSVLYNYTYFGLYKQKSHIKLCRTEMAMPSVCCLFLRHLAYYDKCGRD